MPKAVLHITIPKFMDRIRFLNKLNAENQDFDPDIWLSMAKQIFRRRIELELDITEDQHVRIMELLQ